MDDEEQRIRVTNAEIDREDAILPILFEECYVLADSQNFIDTVRASSKLQVEEQKHSDGVHLFVMAHGF